ncbi:MAG: hypothetical protein ACRDRH_00240 [Pseudonocardia sp.]
MIGKYQATIYPEDNGYIGAISLGFDGGGNRKRIKRRGRTKMAVTDKLRTAVDALETGLDASDSYTVADAVRDWLVKGLKGRDARTIATNRIFTERHVIPLIGAIKLKELTADQVDEWLEGLTGKLATTSLQRVHAILKRATRQAQARNKVLRNVAELVTTPKGKEGRPSKAMTLKQATAWVEDGAAWVPVTEAGFDHERFAIYVWPSVRANGDTKTEKSRRTLELPTRAAEALRTHHVQQAREPAGGRQALAGSRPRLRQPGGDTAGRIRRSPGLQSDHQEGRAQRSHRDHR